MMGCEKVAVSVEHIEAHNTSVFPATDRSAVVNAAMDPISTTRTRRLRRTNDKP